MLIYVKCDHQSNKIIQMFYNRTITKHAIIFFVTTLHYMLYPISLVYTVHLILSKASVMIHVFHFVTFDFELYEVAGILQALLHLAAIVTRVTGA